MLGNLLSLVTYERCLVIHGCMEIIFDETRYQSCLRNYRESRQSFLLTQLSLLVKPVMRYDYKYYVLEECLVVGLEEYHDSEQQLGLVVCDFVN